MTTPAPQPESCPECAALVTDLARHATWHVQVVQGGARSAGREDGDEPGQRTIGNMR